MDGYLRQSTAVDLPLGPFLDSTDGVTAETALTISQADVRLKKNNGAWTQINDSTSATHEENGWYEKEFDATDTDTVGILKVAVHESGALPVWHTFVVLEEAVYDAFFAASAPGFVANASVNVAQISGDSVAADNLELAFDDTPGQVRWFGIIDQGTAQAATGTTLQLRAGASFANDIPVGSAIFIWSATTGAGQWRMITDYVDSTDTATVDTWTVTPTGTIQYIVFGVPPSSQSAPFLADVVKWNGTTVATPQTAGYPVVTHKVGTASGELNSSGGKVPATIAGGDMGTDSITSVALATSAATEIADLVWNTTRSGHSTAGTFGEGVASVQGNVTGSVGSASAIGSGGITAGSFAAGAIDAGAIATDAIGANELAASATAEIAAAVRTELATELGRIDVATSTRATPGDVSNEMADAIFTDVIPDSTPADGSRPSLGQGVLLTTRYLLERGVTGTTETVRKEDGTTAVITSTLNDATNPTNKTRTT